MRAVKEDELQRLGELVALQRVLRRAIHELDSFLAQQEAVGRAREALSGVEGKHRVVLAEVRQEQGALSGTGLDRVADHPRRGVLGQRLEVRHLEAASAVPIGGQGRQRGEQFRQWRHRWGSMGHDGSRTAGGGEALGGGGGVEVTSGR